MIKLFGKSQREKAKKTVKPGVEMKAAAARSPEKTVKKSAEQKQAPRELFWDGYSDIGYC